MTDNGNIFRERIREVVQARIGDYLPNERNPKIHGELQNERLRAILENWGKVGVLLTFVDDDGRDVIFDGHARRNQNPDETWHIALTDLTRQEANELVLMYDPIAALATMDRAAMDGLLREVQTTDASLTAMLGEMAEEAGLYFGENGQGEGAADAEPQTNRAEELREEWGTELGQLWVLPSRDGKGCHKLICGDCTDAAVVERVMDGERAALGIHDPPYNVAQDTDLYAQNQSKALKALAESEWDRDFEPEPFLGVALSVLLPDAWCYVFTAHHLFGRLFDWMNREYAKTSFCVWCKPNPMPSLAKNTWTFGVELVLFGKNGRPVFNYPDGEHCLNWWPFAKSSDGTHPTQKTLKVIEHIANYCSSEGDVVADFFAGSGTTVVACENLNRYARAIEISPAYVAVCLQRYADAFGIRPQLATS